MRAHGCCLLALLLSAPCHAEARLVFSAFPDQGLPLFQICQRILVEAYGELGIRIETRAAPAARALQDAERGLNDGELCRTSLIAEQPSDLLLIRTPLFESYAVAFANRPLPLHDWSSLKPYRVGFERGKAALELRLKGVRLSPSNGAENGMRKLAGGRVDVHVEDYYSGMCILRQNGIRGIQPLHPVLERFSMHHYLNPRHRDLAPRLEEVLQRMERNGRLHEIEHQVLHEAGLDDLSPP
ncbi:transporter substrate-binding domain-containing protein [Pseudomonas sp. LFM046]|uniref:substrate-binding periplasmic protein n=1 Tax=Pseudomonas sp. LFM046 TaxID=1608357 RepID=UPI000CCC426E|nr:transporter substrate-binding domain-containing protein [Pseudomonas sp. LFM046]